MSHSDFHFRVTVRTSGTDHDNGLAVLHCLRGLAQWEQVGADGSPVMSWSGADEDQWELDRCAMFRFTDENRRERWLQKATELLSGHWEHIESSPNDPAIVPVENAAGGTVRRSRATASVCEFDAFDGVVA